MPLKKSKVIPLDSVPKFETKKEKRRRRKLNEFFSTGENRLEGTSLYFLASDNFFRKFLFSLLFNPLSKFVRYGLSIANAVIFIIYSNSENSDNEIGIVDVMNIVCLSILTLDVILRIITLGLWRGSSTFFRSSIWNAFDFIVAVLGWIFIAFIQFSVFRILIIFKLLSKLSYLSALHSILQSFWFMLPKLRGILLLILFFFLIFVLNGVDYYKNDVSRRCGIVDASALAALNASQLEDLSVSTLLELNVDFKEALPIQWCSKNVNGTLSGFTCPGEQICIDGMDSLLRNEYLGSFDNLGYSILSSFQLISLSGWSRYYYAIGAVEDSPWIPMVWMFTMIFSVVFVVINIVIVAIEEAYSSQKSEKDEKSMQSIPKAKLFVSLVEELSESLALRLSYIIKFRIPWLYWIVQLRNVIALIINSFIFDVFITLVVILNVIVEKVLMASEVNVINEGHRDLVNRIFMFFYIFEVCLKVTFIGVKYFYDVFNLLDFSLTAATIVFFILERQFEIYIYYAEGNSMFNLLYIVRIIRLVAILKRFPLTSKFMRKVLVSVVPGLSFLFFTFSIIGLFALFGNMVFGGYIPDEDRKNFNTFWHSVLTLFIIMTGDNWEEPFYTILTTRPGEFQLSNAEVSWSITTKLKRSLGPYFAIVCSVPFFIGFFILANYLLLNFFTAIVLHSFSQQNEEDIEEKRNFFNRLWKKYEEKLVAFFSRIKKKLSINESNDGKGGADSESEHDNKDFKTLLKKLHNYLKIGRESWVYTILSIVISIFSVVILLFENQPSSADEVKSYFTMTNSFAVMELIVWGFFLFDQVFGIIVEGFFYFLSIPNILDTVFLIECTISVTFYFITRSVPINFPLWILIVRIIVRSLRSFKVIVKFPDLRVYIHSLKNMCASFCYLLILVAVALSMFAIVGNTLLGNSVSYVPEKSLQPKNSTTIDIGITQDYGLDINENGVLSMRPNVIHNNFHTLASSLLTLTELTTMDDWSDEMFSSTWEIGTNKETFGSVFFILFIIIVVLFMISLSIGIIFDGIMVQRNAASLTEVQKYWSYMKRYIYTTNPIPRKIPIIKFFGWLVEHWIFRMMVLAVILLDYCILSAQYHAQSWIYETVINWFSFFCVLLFFGEDVCRFLGYGAIWFFGDVLSVLDCIIFVGSFIFTIVCIILQFGFDYELVELRLILKLMTRTVLYIRILSFIVTMKSVRRIYRTLKISIPSVLNAFVLLVCVMFAYLLIGRALFGRVKFGEHYNVFANFREWDKGIILLAKVLTFDNWRYIMHDLSIQAPYCTYVEPSETSEGFNDCGSRVAAYAYFLSFCVFVSTLILNLLIGIILDNFNVEFCVIQYELTRDDVDEVKEVWAQHDKGAKGFIRMVELKDLISDIFIAECKLGFDVKTHSGNMKFWLLYYELQDGIKFTEMEKKDIKYLVRFNIFLSVNSLFKVLKAIFNRIAICCNVCCRRMVVPDEFGDEFRITDSKKITFNEFVLALCRLKVPNNWRTHDERGVRDEFLRDTVVKLERHAFTRIKSITELQDMEMARKNWKAMKSLRERSIKNEIKDGLKQIFSSTALNKKGKEEEEGK